MFKLFDKDENYISSVENVTSARHIEEINGEDTLELSLIEKELTESEKTKEVDKLYGLPEGTMESAGRNLIVGSKTSPETVTVGQYGAWDLSSVKIDGEKLNHGDTVTYSAYVENIPSGEAVKARLDVWRDDGTYTQTTNHGVVVRDKGLIYVTLTIPDDTTFTRVAARIIPEGYTAPFSVQYSHDKLEKTTPWLEEQINLEGRNLYLDGSYESGERHTVGGPRWSFIDSALAIEGSRVSKCEYNNINPVHSWHGRDISIKPNTEYTSSAWVYISSTFAGTGVSLYYEKDISGRVYADLNKRDEWQQIKVTAKSNSTATIGRFLCYVLGQTAGYVLYDGFKVEEGTEATPWNPALEEVIPWTPAPEDINIKFQETIEKGYKIAHKTGYGHWKEFVVKEVEETHLADGIEKRIYCESSFYETIGDYIEDKRPSGTASSALAVALEPTRWEVGTVDNLGVNATNFYQISAKEAVQKIAETWEAEIQTRVTVVGNKITHRYVDLLKKRGGDYGQRFTYSKNLDSVSRIIHRDDVITALYGYGKGEEVGDGYGRRINFADINGGKAYVENNEAKEIWGRNNPDGTKSHVFSRVYFDDVEEKDLLLSLTQKKLEEASKPLVTYQCSVASFEGIDLGDRVKIIDTEFSPELRLAARVVKIYRDLLEKDRSVVLLGNFIPNITDRLVKQERYINNIRSKEGVYDRADIINADGTLDAQFLNNLVNELNLKMNSQGGYVFISEDGKGLITTNAPTIEESTMAIQLVGGGFRIANSKLPNGNFNWRTFGDGDGFVADLIVAGALQGGKVKFDLTNGTFLIGESTEDYLIYFDGTNLNFAQGREYTWEDIDADNKTWNDLDADNKTWLEVIRSPLYNPYQLTHDLGALESDFGRTLSLISDEETLDMIERAIGGKTLIKGGYINTQLVAARSILANMIKVDDLSAISANIGTVIAGLLKSANGESFFDLTNNRLVTNNADITGGTFNVNTSSEKGSAIRLTYGATRMYLSPYEIEFNNAAFANYIGLGGMDLTNKSTGQRAVLIYNDLASPPNYGLTVGNLQVENFAGFKDINVTGTKNRVVDTENYGRVLLNAYETPKPTFADTGHAQIDDDGLCYIDIDLIFLETIDHTHDYRYFLTKYGKGDIWIKESNTDYFIVEGTPNLKFDWKIEAVQRDYNTYNLEQFEGEGQGIEEIDYISLADEYLQENEKEMIPDE